MEKIKLLIVGGILLFIGLITGLLIGLNLQQTTNPKTPISQNNPPIKIEETSATKNESLVIDTIEFNQIDLTDEAKNRLLAEAQSAFKHAVINDSSIITNIDSSITPDNLVDVLENLSPSPYKHILNDYWEDIIFNYGYMVEHYKELANNECDGVHIVDGTSRESEGNSIELIAKECVEYQKYVIGTIAQSFKQSNAIYSNLILKEDLLNNLALNNAKVLFE